MLHFTYNEKINVTSLCQGDVLTITDEIRAVLKDCHPYFQHEQYKFFIVLTQSCDLVRRNGDCKSQYITLAAVRSYDEYIYRNANYFGVENFKGLMLLDEKKFNTFFQLVERVYNNTESEYFFLAQDSNVGLNEHMIAYLKVSFALKSDLHYDKCLKAKKIELSDEFKAKLGWLVGEMYSRVGTKDWETLMKRSEFIDMIKKDLKDRFVVGEKSKILN